MAKFTINKDYNNQSTVEADRYAEKGTYVEFYDTDSNQVASIAVSKVATIHREES